MTNLDSILKSRDITLLTKVCVVKAMVFPIILYGCELDHKEGWAPKNWCFSVVLEKTFERLWMARRSNKSILKEVNCEYSLERLMLKLKLQYPGHVMWRTDLLEKTLMLGKIEGRRRRGQQRMRWLDGSMDMSLSKLREIAKHREAWYAAAEQQQSVMGIWTILSCYSPIFSTSSKGPACRQRQ